MSRKHLLIILIIVLCLGACALCLCTGCDSLRFAPSQEQKQIAFDAYVTSCHIAKEGTSPSSPEAIRLVADTRTNLSYIGPPVNSYGLKGPEIEDYTATLAKAGRDALARPDANDIFAAAGQGLSLAAQLAILFGFGGSAVGGKKILDWIALARNKSKALEEIVQGSELFMDKASDGEQMAFKAFKDAQNTKQSTATKKLVAEIKLNNS